MSDLWRALDMIWIHSEFGFGKQTLKQYKTHGRCFLRAPIIPDLLVKVRMICQILEHRKEIDNDC